MFLFVLSILFSDWIWVDQTEKISMGLTSYPQYLWIGPEGTREDIVFSDLDMDGDEDMLRLRIEGWQSSLEAFENILTPSGRSWKSNPALIDGIDASASHGSLGVGDLNNDGREELVMVSGTAKAYVNTGEPGHPCWEYKASLMDSLNIGDPDFADVDADGDLDMLTSGPRMWWNKGSKTNPQWEIDTAYFQDIPYHAIEQPTWIDWDQDGVWDFFTTGQTGMADPPPMPGAIILHHNIGTATNPLWEDEDISKGWYIPGCVALCDWNEDGVVDFLFQGNEYEDGYQYYPGKLTDEGLSYDFYHLPVQVWGGIWGTYPAVADLNADKIPEIVLAETEWDCALIGWAAFDYYYPHFRKYSATNETGTLWQRVGHSSYPCDPYVSTYQYGHMQYVDFGNDGLCDYVITIFTTYFESDPTGYYRFYRNQGTKTEPAWVADSTALSSLPPLFPACFLDVDGDGDKDVIGVPLGDSFPKGFMNTGSDKYPHYAEYAPLVSGLENVKPTYFAAGDITDDDLSLADLALGIKEENITAFFNTGQSNPRWHKHEEVFKNLGISGNPSLCDADADGDLDLYVASGGTLHYYNNQSTGAIVEKPDGPSELLATHIGRNVELRFSADSGIDADAMLFLYNAAGQRVAELAPKIEANTLLFSICGDGEGPGVYFYRIVIGRDSYKGKVVLY